MASTTKSKQRGYFIGVLLVGAGLLGSAGSITGRLAAMVAGLLDPNALYTAAVTTTTGNSTPSTSGATSISNIISGDIFGTPFSGKGAGAIP